MDSKSSPTISKRLCHILRLIYYMLRNSISRRKLMMDLQLFFKRGKLAGKALGDIITFHRHGGAASRNAACHSIGLSCSDTPFHLANKRKNRRRRSVEDGFYAGMFAEAFEILNAEELDLGSVVSSLMTTPSPSPGGLWWFGRSPVVVRQLRVTDSPFLMNEEEVVEKGKVDEDADNFIRWFHEQLRREKVESA